ncbi:NPCBM/NEW2 domain-containing protein, partial [Kibdelosporangium lantanae]
TVLTVGGVRYPKGIGAHAESTIVIPVNGACHGIDGVAGVDAETGSAGSVTFEIVADGTSVYTSPVVTSGQSVTFGVPLNRPTTVSLLIHATADGNTSDHADWANPRLSCD